jgi:hypothetical protein
MYIFRTRGLIVRTTVATGTGTVRYVPACMVHLGTSDNGYETVAAVLYCATSQKVEGSIPDCIIGMFHCNPAAL